MKKKLLRFSENKPLIFIKDYSSYMAMSFRGQLSKPKNFRWGGGLL